MRLTTPLVTEMVSPPIGYPTTVTRSCKQGRGPSSSGETPSQKLSYGSRKLQRKFSWRRRENGVACCYVVLSKVAVEDTVKHETIMVGVMKAVV